MADTRPTPVSFSFAVKLCTYLLFNPERFKQLEIQDQKERNSYTDHADPLHRADIVRRAFIFSFALVAGFSFLGCVAGSTMGALGRCLPKDTVNLLQIVGSGLLLWGTLFVRGWEIQSFSGVQFTERVNQWLYRGLCCIGTALIVYSLTFQECKL
jgi:cytochrome c biogenesis protein CcdA